jgi:hypothetical protein
MRPHRIRDTLNGPTLSAKNNNIDKSSALM